MSNLRENQVDTTFKRDGEGTDRYLSVAQNACLLILALTSVINLNSVGNTLFLQIIGNIYAVIILTIFFIVVVLSATDLGLSKFLPYVFTEYLDDSINKNKRRRQYAKGLAIICAGQILATTLLSVIGMVEFSKKLVERPNTESITTTTQMKTQSYDATITSLDKDIADAKLSHAKRLATASRNGHKLVLTAIASKGRNMQELYNAGNGWAAKPRQLGKAIAKARQDSAQLVAKEVSILAKLQAQKADFIANSTTSNATIIADLTTFGLQEQADYQDSRWRNAFMLVFITIISCLGFVITTYLRALYTVSTAHNPHEKPIKKRRGNWRQLLPSLANLLPRDSTRMVAAAASAPTVLPYVTDGYYIADDNRITQERQFKKDSKTVERKTVEDSTERQPKDSPKTATERQLQPLSGQHKDSKTVDKKTVEAKTVKEVSFSETEQLKPAVIMQDTKPVFRHIDDNGKVSYLDKKTVRNNRNKYSSRVAESRTRLKADFEDEKLKKTLARRLERLEYWQNALEGITAKSTNLDG